MTVLAESVMHWRSPAGRFQINITEFQKEVFIQHNRNRCRRSEQWNRNVNKGDKRCRPLSLSFSQAVASQISSRTLWMEGKEVPACISRGPKNISRKRKPAFCQHTQAHTQTHQRSVCWRTEKSSLSQSLNLEEPITLSSGLRELLHKSYCIHVWC